MERAYDAIVVGSGFGGGIAACRLAEQGLRVCVLERGRRFGPGDYPDRLAQFPHALFHPRHNPGGMFDVRIMRDVAVVTGAGVGGGSLVYANVQLRAPDEIFDDPAWPAAIDARRARPLLHPHRGGARPADDAAHARAAAEGRRLRGDGPRRRARRPMPLPIAVHFGAGPPPPVQRRLPAGLRQPRPLRRRLPADVEEHDRHHVRRARRDARRRGLPAARGARRSTRRRATATPGASAFADLQYKTKGEVRAPLLVLAAGTLGSTRLLLHNRRRLPQLSPALGTPLLAATATRWRSRWTRPPRASRTRARSSARS